MPTSDDKAGIRNVYALGLVSFFTDVSSEMVFSLLPVFILGLPGTNPAVLGLIEGIAEALSYTLRAVSGFWSDKFRRRKIIILLGYGVSNFMKPMFALAYTAFDALIFRVGDRIGKGIRTAPRDALISESVPRESAGAAFGLHRTLDQSGAIIGPLLASGFMIWFGLSVRDIFWLSFIPGTFALFIILFFVKETAPISGESWRFLKGIRSTLTSEYIGLLIVVALFSLGAFNFSFILLNARSVGVNDSLIPLVYAVVNLTHTLIAIPSGMMADKFGREKTLVTGYGIFMVAAFLLTLSKGGIFMGYLIAGVFGLYMGIVETVQRAMVPDYSANNMRGTAYGVYYLVVGSAFFLSNAVVGWLWNGYGSSVAALYSIATTLLSIGAMVIFLRKRKN